MAHTVSLDSVIYGDRGGNVAFLDLAEGVIPPPTIRAADSRHGLPVTKFDMVYLGRPIDLFTQALNHYYHQHKASPTDPAGDLRKQRPHPQEALAQHLGVTQQRVSRWATGTHAPRLSREQWGKLVQLHFAPST